MDFLYPKFINATHITNKSNIKNIDKYPTAQITESVYQLEAGTQISIMEEFVGNRFNIARVKIVDPIYSDRSFFGKEVYVYHSDLEEFDTSRSSLKPFKNTKNSIKSGLPQENYLNKVAGIPFIDQSLGMLCVKVLTEYEKVVDLVFFEKLTKEVAREGARIILDSRGLQSDDATIKSFIDNYYSFVYVLYADNLDNLRPCSNIDFIVGIPLRFINNIPENLNQEVIDESKVQHRLTMTSLGVLNKTEKILQGLSSRSSEYYNFLYPDQFTPGFVLSYDLIAVKEYVSSLTELFDFYEKPLRNNNPFEFEMGFSKDLELIYVKIFDGQEEMIPKSILDTFKFRPSFTSQRVINYFLNADSLLTDSKTLPLLDFLNKYVKYPDIEFKTIEFKLPNGEVLSKEEANEFKAVQARNNEMCLSAASAINDIAFSNPAYHFFWSKFGEVEKKPEPTLNEQIKLLADQKKENENRKEFETAVKNTTFKTQLEAVNFVPSLNATWDGIKGGAKESSVNIGGQITDFSKASPINKFLTISSLAKRINLFDYLIKYLICQIKRANSQTDKDILDLVQNLGPDLWNYIIYVSQIQANPNDKKFYQQAIRGLGNFSDLAAANFCTSNKFLIVFMKIVKVLNTPDNVEFVKSLINAGNLKPIKQKFLDTARKAFNPKPNPNLYQTLISDLTKGVLNVFIDISFQAIIDALDSATQCEDDLFDANNNEYKSPLDTHTPIQGYGGSTDNNPSVLRDNRRSALEDSFRLTSRGIDLEQSVDLIESLLNTIQCVLTPLEIADLLDGTPNEETLAIIKSLVINKYLPELNYLLEGNNITLLLTELGKRVNPQATQSIRDLFEGTTRTVGFLDINNNQFSPSLICTPQQFVQYREDILKNKIPKDIADGVLQRRNRKVLDNLNRVLNGGVNPDDIPISALCPAGSSATDNTLFSKLLQNNNEFIDSALSKLLSQFNEESNLFGSKYIENKSLYIRDGKGRLARSIPYVKVFENLVLNISPFYFQNKLDNINNDTKVEIINALQFPSNTSVNEVKSKVQGLTRQTYTLENNKLTVRYYNRQSFYDVNTLISTLIQGRRSNSVAKCGDGKQQVELNKTISDNISNGSIPFFFEWHGSGDVAFEESTLADFYQPTDNEYKFRVAERLRSLDFFVSVTFDDEYFGDDSQEYTFNLWFNDKYAKQFKNMASSVFDDGGEETNASDEDQIESILNKYEQINTGFQIYENKNIFTDIINDNRRYVNRMANELKKFLNSNKDLIEQALKFKELEKVLQRLNETPIFEVVVVNNENNTYTLTINFTSANDTGVITRKYYDITLKGNLNLAKFDTNSLLSVFNSGLLIKRNIDIFDTVVQDSVTGERLFFDVSYGGDENQQGSQIAQWRSDSTPLEDIELETGVFDTNLADAIADTSKFQFTYDTTKTNAFINNVSLDLSKKATDIERACGLIPHYLNTRALKEEAFGDVADIFCSDGPVADEFNNAIKKIVLRLTVRAFTADILIKAYFYLQTLNSQTRKDLYKDHRFVEAIRKYIILELNQFGKPYQQAILNDTRELFDKLTDDVKARNSGFILNESNDLKFDYWVSKEINYFFRYNSYLFENVDNAIIASDDQTAKQLIIAKRNKGKVDIFENFSEFILFNYILMASQVEPAKKNIYNSTKATLANLYSSFFKSEDEEFKELIVEPSSTEMTDFIKSVAKSPNPAALFATKPSLNRYASFLLKAIYNTTKSTISRIARNQDPNLFITKTILDGINLGYGLFYSTLTQQDLEKYMCSGDIIAIYNKMYEKGDYFIPYIFPTTSVGIAFAGLPYMSVLPYIDLTFSGIDTTKNLLDANTEIENFRKNKLLKLAKSFLPADRYEFYSTQDLGPSLLGAIGFDSPVDNLINELKQYGVEFEECDPCGNNIQTKEGNTLTDETLAVCTPEEKIRLIKIENNREFEDK